MLVELAPFLPREAIEYIRDDEIFFLSLSMGAQAGMGIGGGVKELVAAAPLADVDERHARVEAACECHDRAHVEERQRRPHPVVGAERPGR